MIQNTGSHFFSSGVIKFKIIKQKQDAAKGDQKTTCEGKITIVNIDGLNKAKCNDGGSKENNKQRKDDLSNGKIERDTIIKCSKEKSVNRIVYIINETC